MIRLFIFTLRWLCVCEFFPSALSFSPLGTDQVKLASSVQIFERSSKLEMFGAVSDSVRSDRQYQQYTISQD